MKLPVTLRASRRGKWSSTSVSLRPDFLCALRLRLGEPVCAVLDRRRVILCPSEEAEMWEIMLEDFPAFFIREPEKPANTRAARKGQAAGESRSEGGSRQVRRGKKGV